MTMHSPKDLALLVDGSVAGKNVFPALTQLVVRVVAGLGDVRFRLHEDHILSRIHNNVTTHTLAQTSHTLT